MLRTDRTLYSYNDVMIEPAKISNISSRSECNPYIEDEMLPIFTAPMSTVVDEKNYDLWEQNHIIPIMPRNINLVTRNDYARRGKWAAFSLNEFYEMFCNPYGANISSIVWKVLIDIANGHMQRLYDAVKQAKEIHGDKIQIMVGNIANPETIGDCITAGVDMCRVGIGGGSGCITASNTGIYYPYASLLDDIVKEKNKMLWSLDELRRCHYEMKMDISIPGYDNLDVFIAEQHKKIANFKIIADGNIRSYSDVNKALALGADYVMIGSVFASLEESAGKTIRKLGKYYKEFYGMASKEGQIAINGKKTKTSEGIAKLLPITGTIPQWSTNMADYLRSAMSYCNIRDVKDFNPTNVDVNVISSNTKSSINQ